MRVAAVEARAFVGEGIAAAAAARAAKAVGGAAAARAAKAVGAAEEAQEAEAQGEQLKLEGEGRLGEWALSDAVAEFEEGILLVQLLRPPRLV